MSPQNTNTEFSVETHVDVDPEARVRMPMTALGALLGAVIALVATGVVAESLIVLGGGVAGWLLGLVAALMIDRYRKLHKPVDELSRDELYAEAARRDIDDRSDMTKEQLAEAIRDGSLVASS